MSRRRLVHLAAITTLSLSTPAPSRAQTVVGHVLDSLSGAPLATTAVTLLDSTGASLGLAQSDSTGLFVLKARQPGRYQLYVDPMAVSVRSQDARLEKVGFYRRKSAVGYLIGPEQVLRPSSTGAPTPPAVWC